MLPPEVSYGHGHSLQEAHARETTCHLIFLPNADDPPLPRAGLDLQRISGVDRRPRQSDVDPSHGYVPRGGYRGRDPSVDIRGRVGLCRSIEAPGDRYQPGQNEPPHAVRHRIIVLVTSAMSSLAWIAFALIS